jgi:hypothetical protein
MSENQTLKFNYSPSSREIGLRAKLTQAVKRAESKLDLFEFYPVTFSTICWASTSGKPVFICWCAQCKELVAAVNATGNFPEWFDMIQDEIEGSVA